MKPKKKKAGKSNLPKDFGKLEHLGNKAFELAYWAFFQAVKRANMNVAEIPSRMITDSIRQLAYGYPLVFTCNQDEFLVCDPRRYAQMVGKTGG